MNNDKIHEYWGLGSCVTSYLDFSSIMTDFLKDKKVLEDTQFVLIQSLEILPDDGVLVEYDIHHYLDINEDELFEQE